MFLKRKVVTGDTPFFVIGPVRIHHSIWLKLACDRAVLYGNNAFSILLFLTKKTFCEKRFIVKKLVSVLKY